MTFNSDIARQFGGWAAMSLVAWVVLKLIPDANYASALIGIICTFVGNLLAGGTSTLPTSDQTPGSRDFRKLSTAGSFAALCLVLAVSWLLAFSANEFLNSHLEMMIKSGLIKIDSHQADVVLQIGWFEEIGRFVFLPSLLILSGLVGLFSPKKIFSVTVLAVTCVFGLYVVGNLAFELLNGTSQLSSIFGAIFGDGPASPSSAIASALQVVIVIGALLGSIVALALTMLLSIVCFRLALHRRVRPSVGT